MLLRPQRAAVTGRFVLQGAVAPAAKLPRRKTTPAVRSSVRTTLVSIMLPQLLTIPLNPIDEELEPQRSTRLVLQTLVTARHGFTQMAQVVEVEFVTEAPMAVMSVPRTVMQFVAP